MTLPPIRKAPQRRTLLAVATAIFASLAILTTPPLTAQSSAASEDAIRAALVQHLTMYVEWPSWKMDAAHMQFRVCLIGSDPIGPALIEAFKDKSIQQKQAVITHLSSLDRVQECHVLYVGATARREVQRSAAALEQAAVLTVSERSDGSSASQVVGLPRDESHVKVEVNLRTATTSKLVISSRLLQLADITERP